MRKAPPGMIWRSVSPPGGEGGKLKKRSFSSCWSSHRAGWVAWQRQWLGVQPTLDSPWAGHDLHNHSQLRQPCLRTWTDSRLLRVASVPTFLGLKHLDLMLLYVTCVPVILRLSLFLFASVFTHVILFPSNALSYFQITTLVLTDACVSDITSSLSSLVVLYFNL